MIRRPPESRGRNRRLVAGEEQRLLDALVTPPKDELGRLTGPSNKWMLPLVIFAIETAMRRSEILSLCWTNIHLDERYAHLTDTKNRDSRDVPLTIRAVKILTELPRHESGKVFPITADSVKKSFERAALRAGLSNLHFHDLRHEATSRLAQKLDNVLELSAVTSHKSLNMLKRYYHPRTRFSFKA
jgi:integrase